MADDPVAATADDLASVEFERGTLALRVTVRLADALGQDADICLLKYAQALHGIDRQVVNSLSRTDPTLLRRLPLPGASLVVPTNGQYRFQTVVVVGTENLSRFGADAIRDWARLGYGVCTDALALSSAGGSGVVVTTAQGVRIGGGHSVDPTRSISAIVTGLLDGMNAAQAVPPSLLLRHVIITELDPDVAESLAVQLLAMKGELDPPTVTQPLTPTVQSVRDSIGATDMVTAGRLAQSVRQRHPEYGNGTFARCDFADRGTTATMAEWLSRVGRLYKADARAPSSFHLTGRHLVAGLALLDNVVGDAMRETGAYEAIVAELQEKPTDPRERQDVRWAPDTPVCSSGDRLGRVLVARSLARHLSEYDRAEPGASIAMLIDGRWGAGKTSVLSMLVEEFEQRQQARAGGDTIPPTTVVRFDAWRQSRAGPPWLRLMEATRDGLRSTDSYSWATRLRERARLVARWRLALTALLSVAAATFFVLWSTGAIEVSTLQRRLGVSITLASFLSVARTVRASLLPRSERDARTFVDRSSEPMDELAEQFAWLRGRSRGPVLMLIDDLDRCEPSYAVELLDTLQKLARGERPAAGQPTMLIVAAADGRWVRTAYESAHAAQSQVVGEPGRPLGALFLDKIFQVRVSLPELSPRLQTRYLAATLEQRWDEQADDESIADARERIKAAADNSEALDLMRRLPPSTREAVAADMLERLETPDATGRTEAAHALMRFGGLLEANPRSILRFVMEFSALRAARLAEANTISTDSLALWAIANVRWPLLVEFLASDPDTHVPLFRAGKTRIDENVPAELRAIFISPPDELRAVFNHEAGGPLDAPTIKQCIGVN